MPLTRLTTILAVSSLIATAATGQVAFTGTSAITSGNDSGSCASSAFDSNYSTFWTTSSTGQWCGLDAGAAVTLIAYRLTPRQDNTTCNWCWGRGAGANVFEATNDATWSTGVVTLDTLTSFPYIPEFSFVNRPISPGTSYRYYRLRSPSGYGDLAELQLIGNAQSGPNARPVPPTLSPASGANLTSGLTGGITMASLTTSATIYYTIDSSAPSCIPQGIPYSAPVALPVPAYPAVLTVRAIACDSSLSNPASLVSTFQYRSWGWAFQNQWWDTDDGLPTQPYGGNIFGPVSGTYYRTGQYMQMPGSNPNTLGVWLYSSTDLYNWRAEGQILNAPSGIAIVNRPHVVYNASTSTYVLWANCLPAYTPTSAFVACIATSSTANGPNTGTNNWAWSNTSYQPDGNAYGDDNLFVDSDGHGYVVYVTYGAFYNVHISQLSSNYLTVDGTTNALHYAACMEAPILFGPRSGTYFLFLSGCTPYGTQPVVPQYQTASSVLGTWSAQANLFSSDPYPYAQPSSVYLVPGITDGYIFALDNWQLPMWATWPLTWPSNAYNIQQVGWNDPNGTATYLQLPLTFPTTTSVQAVVVAPWNLTYY